MVTQKKKEKLLIVLSHMVKVYGGHDLYVPEENKEEIEKSSLQLTKI